MVLVHETRWSVYQIIYYKQSIHVTVGKLPLCLPPRARGRPTNQYMPTKTIQTVVVVVTV